MTYLDLRSIRLRSGEELRDEREVELQPLMLGGQRYVPVPEKVPAELVVTRATTGTVFELYFRIRLHGPCFRCLEDAVLERRLDLREYQAESPGGSDELTTPYVVEGRLELSQWARDGLALALPESSGKSCPDVPGPRLAKEAGERRAGQYIGCGQATRAQHPAARRGRRVAKPGFARQKPPSRPGTAGSYTPPSKWLSRRRRRPSRAATSVARSTRSRHRA